MVMPKNPLDAILSEVLGDDGGLLLARPWDEDLEEPTPQDEPPRDKPSRDLHETAALLGR